MGRSFEVRKVAMARTAGQKSKTYSKYGKQIYVCAKNGGSDPVANLALKSIIDRAKKEQVPSHVIEKAIERANGAGGENFSSVRYEGFGPGGISVIVDCLTDNNNRTISEIRNCFTKSNAKLGAPGSVAHGFDHLAVLSFKGSDSDTVLETLLGAGLDVTDVESENGQVTVFAPTTEFYKIKSALAEDFKGIELDVEEITFIPHSRMDLAGEDQVQFQKLVEMLNECDDVQEIYHNAKVATPG